MSTPKLVTFLRRRDYTFVRELGQGACGRTVLLRDETLEQNFVCKKYSPLEGLDREGLFRNFVREIKLLHDLHHLNVVRIFNYYLYPEIFSGFILMEHVEGVDIRSYLSAAPEQINDLFLQVVQGFKHLEDKSVLHRDIRHANLMVSSEGTAKIIDLGFGKRIEQSQDFDKSISLNLWCEPPEEFGTGKYDFRTEVYFVGKLFQQIIDEEGIQHFKYSKVLDQMVARMAKDRFESFSNVERIMQRDPFVEIEFSASEIRVYRLFADEIAQRITKIEEGTKYIDDFDRVKASLKAVLRTVTLEQIMPSAAPALRCFLTGEYYFKKEGFPVDALKKFVELLTKVSSEKQRLILSNLHTRFDSVPRYKNLVPTGFDDMDDDIPF